MGALQGFLAGEAVEGDELLDVAEHILANGGLDIDSLGRYLPAATGACRELTPLRRTIPVGLYYYREPDRLWEAAVQVCRLSHCTPADVAAVVAMALATARLLQLTELDPPMFVGELAAGVQDIDPQAAAALGELLPLVNEPAAAVRDFGTTPLGLFQAGLLLFLRGAYAELSLSELALCRSTVPQALAYSLAGSFGRVCRLEKPSLRVVMIAEELYNHHN
jgi:ADP-ribosylglycohydrolase